MKIMDYVKQINASITDVASQEKAKQVRKKLIIAGTIITVISILIVVGAFIAFVMVGVNAVDNASDFKMINVVTPMIFFLIGGILLSIGSVILKAGLAIFIGGETSSFVDRTINKRCECGNTITSDQMFCPKCGRPVRRVCPHCNAVLEPSDTFCRKCGHKV